MLHPNSKVNLKRWKLWNNTGWSPHKRFQVFKGEKISDKDFLAPPTAPVGLAIIRTPMCLPEPWLTVFLGCFQAQSPTPTSNSPAGDTGHAQGFPDKKGQVSPCSSSDRVVKNVIYHMNSSTLKPAHFLSLLAPCRLHPNKLHPTTIIFFHDKASKPPEV